MILLACDLDRTIIPDGPEPLSENAPEEFEKFVTKKGPTLAYFTGRSFNLVQQAFDQYQLTKPDIIVCDVGTNIYLRSNDSYELYSKWQERCNQDWANLTINDIAQRLKDLTYLVLQPPENQNTYKLSYYAPENIDHEQVRIQIWERVFALNIKVSIIITVDQVGHFCYVDVLPASATKSAALVFLVEMFMFVKEMVVYCGDSGNDTASLTSGYKAVVPANATLEFKQHIKDLAIKKNIADKVFIAQGGYLGMNGNYIGGVLEGLHHFNFI